MNKYKQKRPFVLLVFLLFSSDEFIPFNKIDLIKWFISIVSEKKSTDFGE